MTASSTDHGPTEGMPPQVERWQDAGGTWRVATVGTESATVELCRCDAGEVVDVLELQEARHLEWAARQPG